MSDADAADPDLAPPDLPPRLDETLVAAYKEDARAMGLTEDTIKDYGCCLGVFVRQFHGTDPDRIGRRHLKRFLTYLRDEREVSDATISRYFSALNGFFEFLELEDRVDANPVRSFRKRYLRNLRTGYRASDPGERHQLLTVDEMGDLINTVLNARDRAILTVLAKTGVRRGELSAMDVDDVDWDTQSILLKDLPKRKANRRVFFDDEAARVLRRWLRDRRAYAPADGDEPALFLGQHGIRLKREGIYNVVTDHAERAGFHDPDSDDPQERLTPHSFRHWFTTHLRRSGMPAEFIAELRGDVRGRTMDLYDHIDREELRRAYLRNIPKLYLS